MGGRWGPARHAFHGHPGGERPCHVSRELSPQAVRLQQPRHRSYRPREQALEEAHLTEAAGTGPGSQTKVIKARTFSPGSLPDQPFRHQPRPSPPGPLRGEPVMHHHSETWTFCLPILCPATVLATPFLSPPQIHISCKEQCHPTTHCEVPMKPLLVGTAVPALCIFLEPQTICT